MDHGTKIGPLVIICYVRLCNILFPIPTFAHHLCDHYTKLKRIRKIQFKGNMLLFVILCLLTEKAVQFVYIKTYIYVESCISQLRTNIIWLEIENENEPSFITLQASGPILKPKCDMIWKQGRSETEWIFIMQMSDIFCFAI